MNHFRGVTKMAFRRAAGNQNPCVLSKIPG
nr:MAG TPA: hypothetical protein [Caudoviricetes sp.]